MCATGSMGGRTTSGCSAPGLGYGAPWCRGKRGAALGGSAEALGDVGNHPPIPRIPISPSKLNPALAAQRMIACADLAHARDGRRVAVPGIVLVR